MGRSWPAVGSRIRCCCAGSASCRVDQSSTPQPRQENSCPPRCCTSPPRTARPTLSPPSPTVAGGTRGCWCTRTASASGPCCGRWPAIWPGTGRSTSATAPFVRPAAVSWCSVASPGVVEADAVVDGHPEGLPGAGQIAQGARPSEQAVPGSAGQEQRPLGLWPPGEEGRRVRDQQARIRCRAGARVSRHQQHHGDVIDEVFHRPRRTRRRVVLLVDRCTTHGVHDQIDALRQMLHRRRQQHAASLLRSRPRQRNHRGSPLIRRASS